jgi:hypothetical protein
MATISSALPAELAVRVHAARQRSADLCEWSQWLCAVSTRLCREPIRGGAYDLPTRPERTLDKTCRGGLPAPLDCTLWVGPGSLKACDGCGEVIAHDEREFEVQVSETLTFRFHAECHKAWLTFGRGGRFRVGA